MAYDFNLAAWCRTGTCRCFGRWRCCIEFRVRRSDVCDRAQLSRLHIFDGRLPGRGYQRYRCCRQLDSGNVNSGQLDSRIIKVTPGQRVSAISNDAGTFSLSITELTQIMPDKDWIAKLQPDEAEAALKKLAELMDQPLSPRFATRLQTLERAIKAKAGST